MQNKKKKEERNRDKKKRVKKKLIKKTEVKQKKKNTLKIHENPMKYLLIKQSATADSKNNSSFVYCSFFFFCFGRPKSSNVKKVPSFICFAFAFFPL